MAPSRVVSTLALLSRTLTLAFEVTEATLNLAKLGRDAVNPCHV